MQQCQAREPAAGAVPARRRADPPGVVSTTRMRAAVPLAPAARPNPRESVRIRAGASKRNRGTAGRIATSPETFSRPQKVFAARATVALRGCRVCRGIADTRSALSSALLARRPASSALFRPYFATSDTRRLKCALPLRGRHGAASDTSPLESTAPVGASVIHLTMLNKHCINNGPAVVLFRNPGEEG